MAKETKQKTKVSVSKDNTVEEILALEEKGAELVFSFDESFLELSDETVEKLGHENQRQYFIALGAHRAFVKQKSKDGPTAGLEIKDPLQGKAPNKLRVLRKLKSGEIVDVSRGWTDEEGTAWHPCWKRPDEEGEVKDLGYLRVTQESDPDIVTRGASAAGTSRVIQRKDGTDDLILFKIQNRIFEEHLHAQALISGQRAGTSMRELQTQLKEVNRKLELEDTSSEITATIDRDGEHIISEKAG